MMRSCYACAVMALVGTVCAQTPTPTPTPPPSSPPAQPPPAAAARTELAELAFLAGTWRGTMEGDYVEEQWSEPVGAGVMGTFRWQEGGPDGVLNMLELLSITAEEGGVFLRLRHFNGPALNPWASEAESATTLRLSESAAGRAVFANVDPAAALESVSYESPEPARLLIGVNFRAESGRPALNFALTRREARPASPVSAAEARAAFERFKSLSGSWTGTSTKGWKETITYKTIAGGSAVLETSFDAHPDETMVTMIHPDGERLLLTHYCVAKNQPRLVLSRVEDEGRTLTFEFLDATNLRGRDRGHMDKVVMKFIDGDRFTSRWTWYQDGKENWMEEIVQERVKGDAAASPAGAGSGSHGNHR